MDLSSSFQEHKWIWIGGIIAVGLGAITLLTKSSSSSSSASGGVESQGQSSGISDQLGTLSDAVANLAGNYPAVVPSGSGGTNTYPASGNSNGGGGDSANGNLSSWVYSLSDLNAYNWANDPNNGWNGSTASLNQAKSDIQNSSNTLTITNGLASIFIKDPTLTAPTTYTVSGDTYNSIFAGITNHYGTLNETPYLGFLQQQDINYVKQVAATNGQFGVLPSTNDSSGITKIGTPPYYPVPQTTLANVK